VKTAITLAMMSAMFAPWSANADGGTVQLREASGPFVVTVFTAPEPLRAGPIDTSVLVQDRETGRVILDATVNFAFSPSVGTSPRFLTRVTHAQARNKLLQAATVDVLAPGWWTMQVSVRRGREEVVLATKLLVMPSVPRLTAIWPFLFIPPFAIGLFALHQTLRRRKRLRQVELFLMQ
jgi:hypothetical protein